MEPRQSWTLLGNYPLRHYSFENGLNAYLLHNPISPVAAFLTHYTVGSASEEDSERGLAHFFEHMMFRETDSLGDGDFDRIIAQSGGVGLNAFTSYDTTAFHVSLPSKNLERVIGLESDRMANLKLSEALIEIERGAVLGEMNMYKDMPSEQMWETLTAEAFSPHPYRHPVIGYEEQVRNFAQRDFERFYRAHYAPNRAVVVVYGSTAPITPPTARWWWWRGISTRPGWWSNWPRPMATSPPAPRGQNRARRRPPGANRGGWKSFMPGFPPKT